MEIEQSNPQPAGVLEFRLMRELTFLIAAANRETDLRKRIATGSLPTCEQLRNEIRAGTIMSAIARNRMKNHLDCRRASRTKAFRCARR